MPKSAHAKSNGSDPTVIATPTESLEREDAGSAPDRAGGAVPRTRRPHGGQTRTARSTKGNGDQPSLKASEKTQKPEKKAEPLPDYDLSSPELYLNRELAWLAFNERVLHEAEDERTPLLERMKFLAIVSSNLDEFFMKRIGGLKQQVGAGVQSLTVDGRTPQQQIQECCQKVLEIEEIKEVLLLKVLSELESHGIFVLSYDRLDDDDRQWLRDYYVDNIFPLVTPQAIDPAHPFPFISNLSLNLLVTLSYEADEELRRARIKVPLGTGFPRFLRIADSNRFVPLEQIMSNNLDLLFPKMTIEACEFFYVTRNANTERDEERADDLLAMIESELRDRRFAQIVRTVVQSGMDPVRRGMLAADLGLNENTDVFAREGLLRMRDLVEIANLEFPALRDPPHHPVDHASLHTPNMFYAIRDAGSILLQHPYESFPNSVERFLKEASRDPKVHAIKMSLYRTSAGTRVIDHLITAAQNGKQVAVVVELKARFDEAANIRWASRLEEAGIHVTYGVMGLKTHCKVTLVVRRDYNGLRLYVHVGTGNYHADTARLYDDLGLITCDEIIGRDVVELFNYLTTGYTPKRRYRKILPAPKLLKRSLIDKIRREIDQHNSGEPGLIQMKLNALEDADVVRELYLASQAGVHTDLIVRDTCRLRPGMPGLSENVNVISVVGRFLEHSRMFYFRNGGAEEYFIGSADAMKRNLENRVEVVVPVEDAALKEQLREILDLHLEDRRSAWDMLPDGRYVQRSPVDAETPGCQEQLNRVAEDRDRSAKRLKRRKPRMISRRNVPD